MSDERCIVCNKSGGLYLTCGPYKTGPYCSQHRWELGEYIKAKQQEMIVQKFNHLVNQWQLQKKEREKKHD